MGDTEMPKPAFRHSAGLMRWNLGGEPLSLAVIVSLLMVGLSAPALAGKPAPVVEWSNGFPSGEHFNLNIHGKKADYACEPEGDGGSVFVPEYGAAEIQLVQNKRSSVENLTVHDKCGGFGGDAALVELPSGEYQVYARILAKPSKSDETREVVFYPKLVEACNDSGTENFTDATDCDESFLLGTGVVTKDGAFDTEGTEFERTKGKSKATDITGMFQWTGWACDQAFDTNGNGEIDVGDLNATIGEDGFAIGDLDKDGDIDEDDLALYLAENCVHHESTWVYDIADLVVYGWDYQNNGSKLVQVRFYPTDTTEFS